jgi:tetrahydromethanopterin S-methyltransferase subunit A
MNPTFTKVYSEIQRGMKLSRCRKCGCMRGTLGNLKASLPLLKLKDAKELLKNVHEWEEQLEPQEYPCFGCKYCIPPEAMTILTNKYPVLASATLSSCEITIDTSSWPPVEGEYTVLNASAPVAVSTLSSTKLEDKIVKLNPEGLCIVGKTETENIGIDKIVKNVITNPSISYVILTGKDTAGHQPGKAILALWENGVDKNMRIVGSNGRRPILKNVSRTEINKFRKQVQIEDMIGTENSRSIAKRVKELALAASTAKSSSGCGCSDDSCNPAAVAFSMPVMTAPASGCGCGDVCADEPAKVKKASRKSALVPTVKAKKISKSSVKLDKAGYFVILLSKKNSEIIVEHYSYDNKLLRKIEGKRGRDIYFAIINNKWVSELSHAAYLGKELLRAELSIEKGFKFVQDGA